MVHRIKRLTGALLIVSFVIGVQTAGAAPTPPRAPGRTVTSPERDRAGNVLRRLRLFFGLLGFSNDLIGPRP
jgi:hypothetical protein